MDPNTKFYQNMFNSGNTTGICRHNRPHMYSIYAKNTQ